MFMWGHCSQLGISTFKPADSFLGQFTLECAVKCRICKKTLMERAGSMGFIFDLNELLFAEAR